MIFLMMIDTPEEKRKFVILYEKYRYLMQKVATDVLRDCFWQRTQYMMHLCIWLKIWVK